MNVRIVCLIAASAVALGAAGCGSDSSSNAPATTPSTPATTPSTAATTPATTPTTSAIDGKDLFINGKPSTGALSCGNCHTLKAAGTTGVAGPNLDELAPDDNAAAIAEMITDPNAEIVAGFKKDIMPQDYGTTLTPAEVQAIATYIDKNSAHAE